MFREARIGKDDDMAFLKQMGVESVTHDDKRFFLLPCMGLDGKLCTLYHDKRRFKVCKEFECKLLKQYISREVSYDSAVNTIKEVMIRRQSIKELSEVLQITSNSRILSVIRELKKSGKMDDPSFRRMYSRHILDCLILEDLLIRKFCKENKKTPEYYKNWDNSNREILY